jgi:hypothetical protein
MLRWPGDVGPVSNSRCPAQALLQEFICTGAENCFSTFAAFVGFLRNAQRCDFPLHLAARNQGTPAQKAPKSRMSSTVAVEGGQCAVAGRSSHQPLRLCMQLGKLLQPLNHIVQIRLFRPHLAELPDDFCLPVRLDLPGDIVSRLHSSTLVYLENVGSQYVSLRQVNRRIALFIEAFAIACLLYPQSYPRHPLSRCLSANAFKQCDDAKSDY